MRLFKKVAAALVSGAMVVSLAACAGTNTETTAAETTQAEETKTEETNGKTDGIDFLQDNWNYDRRGERRSQKGSN